MIQIWAMLGILAFYAAGYGLCGTADFSMNAKTRMFKSGWHCRFFALAAQAEALVIDEPVILGYSQQPGTRYYYGEYHP